MGDFVVYKIDKIIFFLKKRGNISCLQRVLIFFTEICFVLPIIYVNV